MNTCPRRLWAEFGNDWRTEASNPRPARVRMTARAPFLRDADHLKSMYTASVTTGMFLRRTPANNIPEHTHTHTRWRSKYPLGYQLHFSHRFWLEKEKHLRRNWDTCLNRTVYFFMKDENIILKQPTGTNSSAAGFGICNFLSSVTAYKPQNYNTQLTAAIQY